MILWLISAFVTILLFSLITQALFLCGLHSVDLAKMKDVSEAQISLDGKFNVFTVGEVSPDCSRTFSRLWLVPARVGEVHRLTQDKSNEFTPRWSPDGKWVAVYSDCTKRHGLWITSLEGSEPRLVAHVFRSNFHLTHQGESFTWSSDSKRQAFLSSPDVILSGEGQTAVNASLSDVHEYLRHPLTREEIDRLPAETHEMILHSQGQVPRQITLSKLNPKELNAVAPLTDFLSQNDADPRVITRLQYKSRTSFSDNKHIGKDKTRI